MSRQHSMLNSIMAQAHEQTGRGNSCSPIRGQHMITCMGESCAEMWRPIRTRVSTTTHHQGTRISTTIYHQYHINSLLSTFLLCHQREAQCMKFPLMRGLGEESGYIGSIAYSLILHCKRLFL